MPDLVGQIVGAKWEIVSRLGEGTFGDVWVARHVVTGRRKALKLLHASYSASAEATERFVREAQAASQIDSPHVVGVDDIGHDDGLRRAYLVMELLRGESLYDYLVRQPYQMAYGEAIVVLRQVAAALDAAHRSGIVHRDLKPENIFLSWKSEGTVLVKVLDFGIAKLASEGLPAPASLDGAGLRRARTVGFVGTIGYAAPEQILDSASVGVPADVFALGICAYEMLTGASYWRADQHDDLVAEIRRGIDVPPSRRAPAGVTLPAGYDEWMARACAQDPATRFTSAGEAINALEEALDQHDPLPSPAPRTSVPRMLETTGSFRTNGLPIELREAAQSMYLSSVGASRALAQRAATQADPRPSSGPRPVPARTSDAHEVGAVESEPAPVAPGSRKRTPIVVAAVVLIAGLATAAVVRSGTRSTGAHAATSPPPTMPPPASVPPTAPVAPAVAGLATPPVEQATPPVPPAPIRPAARATPLATAGDVRAGAAAVPPSPAAGTGRGVPAPRRGDPSARRTPSSVTPYEPPGL